MSKRISDRDIWLAHVESLLDAGLYDAAAYSLSIPGPYGDIDGARTQCLAARAELGRGDYRSALEHADRALVADPASAEAWQLVAVARFMMGELVLAAAAADRAFGCAPANWQCHALVSELERLVPDRRGQALEAAESVRRARPEDAYSHALVGAAQTALFLDVPAEATFKQALALDPDQHKAHFGLGIIALRHLFLGSGAKHFIRLIRDPQLSRPSVFNLGVATSSALGLLTIGLAYTGFFVAGFWFPTDLATATSEPWRPWAWAGGLTVTALFVIWRAWGLWGDALRIGIRQLQPLGVLRFAFFFIAAGIFAFAPLQSMVAKWTAVALWCAGLAVGYFARLWMRRPADLRAKPGGT